MSRLIISTWLWGTKYGPEYLERLQRGVQRWHRQRYEWRVFHPEPEDLHLTAMPGCLCRLRMFDQKWQQRNGIRKNDRLVCMDLDSIVTGPIDHSYFERDDKFTILWGANSENKNPFNGSLMMLRAGHYEEVWSEFTIERLWQTQYHQFPDDQGWIWHMIPNASGWKAGYSSGIYAFKKPGWPRGDDLPHDARLVVFPGWRDPSQFVHLPWVQKHWVSNVVAN